MKKILSGILCLTMMLSMGVTAFADSSDFVLTYSNEASYEITIPAAGTVDKATGKGTIEIDISDANLADGTAVSVTATSSNYADGSWYLVNTKDSTDKIAYTIGTTEGGSDVASGGIVVASDSATSATFYVTVSDTSKVGTFTDTITFTSEIADLVDFTINGASYLAVEGMSVGSWVNSTFNADSFVIGDTTYGKTLILNGGYFLYNGDCVLEDLLIEGAMNFTAAKAPMPV